MKKMLWALVCAALAVAVFSEDADFKLGKIRVKLSEKSGSFLVYVMDSSDSYFPVFAEQGNGASSYFSLKVESKIYKLLREGGVTVSALTNEGSAALTYNIKNTARVSLVFSPVSTIPGAPEDAFKLTVSVINLSDKAQTFTLKGILDTDIGEFEGPVFSTAVYPEIKSEIELTSLQSHQWLCVSSLYSSLRILFAPQKNSAWPVSATLANKDVLSSSVWSSIKHPGRSFSSFASYNNAALELLWDPVMLKPGESRAVSLYFTVTAGISAPAAALYFPSASSPAGGTAPLASAATEGGGGGIFTPVPGVSALESMGITPEQVAAAQLDPAYVEELLRKIQELAAQGPGASQERIQALNAELDAVLHRLRR